CWPWRRSLCGSLRTANCAPPTMPPRRGAVDEQGAPSQHHPSSTMEDPLTLTQDRRTELLAGCRLFAGVAPPDLATVASRAVEVDFPANHVIARQGEIGTGFFLIVSGSVRVVRGGEDVAVLGPGEFFGELSVLDGQPRGAQGVSVEPTRCPG